MRLRRLMVISTTLAALNVDLLAAQAIDNDDIAGVVAGPNGPEAGVWVIAETTELPTRFARIVVTDDRGRYLIPDLPAAGGYPVGHGVEWHGSTVERSCSGVFTWWGKSRRVGNPVDICIYH